MTEALPLLGYAGAILALFAALGSWPTLLLARGFPSRAALAPVVGFALAACLLSTAGGVLPMRVAAWAVLLPAALLSLGLTGWWARRSPGCVRTRRSELLVPGAIGLTALLLVLLPGMLRGTVGPINFYFADAWGYILPDLWVRDHTLYDGLTDAGVARFDVPLAQGQAFVALGTRPGLYTTTSAASVLLGTSPDQTHLAVLAAVMALTTATVWFLARALGLRPALAALAAAFALSPSVLTLPGDSSLGNMAALALAPALLLVGGRALTRREPRHLALAALLLGGLVAVYVEFLPPLLATAAVGLAALAARQAAGRRLAWPWAGGVAARLCVVAAGAVLAAPVATERGFQWARALENAPSAALAFARRDISLEDGGAWAFGVLHLYELPQFHLLSPLKTAVAVGLPILLAGLLVVGALARRWTAAFVLAPIPGALVAAGYAYRRYQEGHCEYCAWHALTFMLPFLGVGLALGVDWAMRRSVGPQGRLLAVRAGVLGLALAALGAAARADVEVVRNVADSRQVLLGSTRELVDDLRALPRPATLLIEAPDASPVPVWTAAEALWLARQAGVEASIDEQAPFYIGPPLPRDDYYSPAYAFVLSPFGGIRTDRRLIDGRRRFSLYRRAPIDVTVARTGWALDPAEGRSAIPWVNAPFQLWLTTRTAARAALTVELARPQRDRASLSFAVAGRPAAARAMAEGSRLCVELALRPGRTVVDVQPVLDVVPPFTLRLTAGAYGWPLGPPPQAIGLAGLRARPGSCAPASARA